MKNKKYFVYILECKDKTFYTGITNDLKERIARHNNAKSGAHYTKTRRPVVLRYSEICSSKSDALKREYAIKSMTRVGKIALIKGT